MKLELENPPQGTIRDWLEHRAKLGGTAFTFTHDEKDISWEQLLIDAKKIAAKLTQLGIEKGESIAIIHPNGPGAIRAFFAVTYGGFRATMINLAAGQSAIQYALSHSKTRFAFVHESANDLFNAARHENIAAVDFDNMAEINPTELHEITAKDHALLMYTSGTTGTPKGVVHSHASLLAGGWTTAIAHKLNDQDRGFCVLPIYHINGLCVTIMGSLVSGGSLAMCPKFSASNFWQHLEMTQATWFSAVPTIISHLIHNDSNPSNRVKARIRFGRSASSALAVDVQKAFEERFQMPIIETMGLTETAAQILSNPLPPGIRKIGSPGKAYGNEVAIMDENFNFCDENVEGELVIKGPNLMLEYLDNDKATHDTFHGEWLRTGDLGRMDGDGYLFITGRLKELIIKGGENIAPREIDEALYSNPDVIEAAAFACPCKVYGERVEAAVRLKEHSNVTREMLKAVCVERLGNFKSPDEIYFLDELPKGPSGKIQRLKLLERVSLK